MGFLQGFTNLLTGKPVFDETVQSDTAQVKPEMNEGDEPRENKFVNQQGRKIIPDISFRKFKSSRSGQKVTTWAWVTNSSPFEVEVETLEFHGYRNHIKRRLRPAESYEVKVYDGPVITNDNDHNARLYFTIHENDDLFQEDYDIEYSRESGGTYTLEEFHKNNTPRDI